jgi:DUF2075 family protein
MIIYSNTASGFREDVDSGNKIVNAIDAALRQKMGRAVGHREKEAWQNSLGFMERVLRRAHIPDDCGVLVEYVIPATSNRIDFLVSGRNGSGEDNFVLIELKQWQKAESTDLDGIVMTAVGGGVRETRHPSYQAYSYKAFLADYNEDVSSGELGAHACAFLHNYEPSNPEPLRSSFYGKYLEEAPIYFKNDQAELEAFLTRHVGGGKGVEILYRLEEGRLKPTKKLMDFVGSLFGGGSDFVLLDEQKSAFEIARSVAIGGAAEKGKQVVVIKGGPGTGKSVVSMNLLGVLLKHGLSAQFVAPNASFRDVMMRTLARGNSLVRLKSLFKGSSSFTDSSRDAFDVVIVDEAHRLKNGAAYQYRGENQIEDIVKAAKVSIFFVDDSQVIRPEDIGSTAEIRRVATGFGAEVSEIELVAQFRCSGATGYVNWLDDVLRIRDTANFDGWDRDAFEFKIFDNPNDLHAEILAKHSGGLKARLLAGYAWKWSGLSEGNRDAQKCDVEVPEFDFRLPWNSRKIGTTWAMDEGGVSQVGCIHTSQGLEFDYVGVIVGKDLRFDVGSGRYVTEWNSYKDRNGKKGMKEKPEELNLLVRNIYKVLMTRGIKGCYVYFEDKEMEKIFKERLAATSKE